MFSRDIVVVGAGVFGAWTALLCARAGHRVTLLDQHGPANCRSSSSGESRIIRSAYGSDEVYTRMARRSLDLWREFLRAENRTDYFRQTGVLWIARREEPSIWKARSIFDRLGVTHDWLAADGIAERFPQFELPEDAVAIFEPEGGALAADQCIEAVLAAALRAGVRHEVAEVKPPSLYGSCLSAIETADGRQFAGDCFLFACGSWLPKLFDVLKDVIRPTRQDVFFFDAPSNFRAFQPGVFPIWIDQSDAKIAYGFPDLGNGLKMGFHRLGPAFDPDMPGQTAGSREIFEAQHYLEDRFPALAGTALRKTEICHYENTANGDFLIDRHPDFENVWFIGGGSGHGFKHGPAVAEYVISLVDGTGPLEPRFSLKAKLNVTDGRVL